MEKSTLKKYDLEGRTFQFLKKVITYVDQLPKRIAMTEIGRQLMRVAGSLRAKNIEAKGALGKKDLIMRIKI
jgi:hypothetical protein